MSANSDPFPGKPTAAVMLLGTFHFQDTGLDDYQPQFNIDIFSERRQQEVGEVVEHLAQFQPTKIAVERRPERQEETDQSYLAYLRGEFQLPGSELYQLGFRLAQRLNHHKLYCVDAWGRYYEPQNLRQSTAYYRALRGADFTRHWRWPRANSAALCPGLSRIQAY